MMRTLLILCLALVVSLPVVHCETPEGEPEGEHGELSAASGYHAEGEHTDGGEVAEAEDHEDHEESEPEETEDLGMEPIYPEGDAISSDQIRKLHKKIDVNSDGKVSMNELLEFSKTTRHGMLGKDEASVFGEMDSDGDGKVSLKEMVVHNYGEETPDDGVKEDGEEHVEREKGLEKEKFKAADANGDGFLDTKELRAAFYPETNDIVLTLVAQHNLKRKDLDGDGVLTSDEMWEVSHEDESDSQREEDAKEFEKLDLDKDGKINLEEYKHWESGHHHTKSSNAIFMELADKDKDEHLTAEEVDEAREAVANSVAGSQILDWIQHYEEHSEL